MAGRRDRRKSPRPRGTRSRASKQKKADRKQSEAERARRRYVTTRFALDQPEDLPWTQVHALVEERVAAGELPSPAPSYHTLYRWIKKAEAIQKEQGRPICQADYRDGRRSGRPEKDFHPVVREYLDQELALMSFTSIAGLHRDLVEFARAKHIEDEPSLSMVKREVEKLDLEEESAAMHGSKAAVLDAMPKATVPADHPHEIWTLDEFRSPVFIRAVNPLTDRLTGVRPWVILIADNCSRAVLARYVVPPLRDAGKVSFTEDDVLGTVLAAALLALAPAVCREYAGYLPEVLRWDKAGPHRSLRAGLVRHGVEVPRLPGEQPYKRGSIERLIGTTKGMFTGIRGHKDLWKPVTRTGPGKAKRRKKKSTRTPGGGRKPRRQAIPVEDLHSYDEFVELVDEKIHEYNHSTHRMLGASPHAVHLSKFRKDRARPGRDALFFMEPRVLTCTKGGVEYGNTPFAWDSGGQELTVGQQIVCRADPLLRGLFADVDGDIRFLEPLSKWARRMRGEDIDRERNERAHELSEYAAAVREERLVDEVGEEALVEAKRRLQERSRRKKGSPRRREASQPADSRPAEKKRPKRKRSEGPRGDRPPPGVADPRKRIRIVP